MATNYVQTTRQIVTAALRKLGVTPTTQGVEGEDFVQGLFELNLMLKSWQNIGLDVWLKASQSLTLTTAASYTLDPERPMNILSARLKRNGIEIPMQQLTRDEYDNLPQKTTTGLPTSFHYDRQRENARFYVWPVLASASGETVEITYTREVEDVRTGAETLDIPVEWYEAIVYSLADRLADTYAIDRPKVTQRAEQLVSLALAHDREGSVFFGEEPAYPAY